MNISLDMINQIHLTQGKDELWEKAVEINKITENGDQIMKVDVVIENI